MAEVVSIENTRTGGFLSEKDPVETRNGCKYAKGCEVWPDGYNPDIRVECTQGIHFFLTREEAMEWT